jgi:integrase
MPTKVPSLCRFKPRNLACVWVSPTRRIYLGPWGSPESHERYAEVIRRILAGEVVTEAPQLDRPARPACLTIGKLVDKYLDHARGYYSRDGVPTSEYHGVETAVRLAEKTYKALPAVEFGPLCLEDVRDRMIESKLARSTINGRTRRIVAMFKWAAAKQLVPQETHAALTMVAGLRAGRSAAKETKPVESVSDDVVDATLPHLPPIVADMVRLQRLCGARPGEVCAMRPVDIDRSADVWLYQPADHKTAYRGKRRTIFLGPQAQAILLRYLARDAKAFCFSPADSEAKRRAELHAARSTPMSCGNRPGTNVTASPLRRAGDRYRKDSYARAIARACELAFPAPEGMKEAARREWIAAHRWSPNQLRHSFATAVRRDHGLDNVQVLLGHSTAKTTEIYAELDIAKGAAVARLIG